MRSTRSPSLTACRLLAPCTREYSKLGTSTIPNHSVSLGPGGASSLQTNLAFGDVKQELFETVRDYFAPQAEHRRELLANPDGIRQILARGADKARYAASKTLRKVRKKTGLLY